MKLSNLLLFAGAAAEVIWLQKIAKPSQMKS